jgi:hypothetical protein
LCRSAASRITFVKAVNATSRVNQFLFAGEKRVTFRADFDAQIFAGRTGFKAVAAGARNIDFVVIRVYLRFHYFNGLL